MLSLAEHTNLLRATAVGVQDRLANKCGDCQVLSKAFDYTFGKTMHVSLQLMLTDSLMLNLSNLVDFTSNEVSEKLMPIPEGNLGNILHSAAPFSCRAVLRSHAHDMLLDERPACALCMPLCHDTNQELLCAMLLASNGTDAVHDIFKAWSTWGPARSKIVGTMVITLVQPDAAHATRTACNALLLSAIIGSSIIQTSSTLLKAAAEHAGIRGTYIPGAGFVVPTPSRLGIAHLMAAHSGESVLTAGSAWDATTRETVAMLAQGGDPPEVLSRAATHGLATPMQSGNEHDNEEETQPGSPDVPKQCGFRSGSLGSNNGFYPDDDPDALSSRYDSAMEGCSEAAMETARRTEDGASTSQRMPSPTSSKASPKESDPLAVMWEDVRLAQHAQDLVYCNKQLETQYMLHEYGGVVSQLRHWINVITCVCMLWQLLTSSSFPSTLMSSRLTILAMVLVTLGMLCAGIACRMPSHYWRTHGREHLLMASLCIHHIVCGPEFSRRGLLDLKSNGLPSQGLVALHIGFAAAAWATLHGLRYYRMRHVLMMRGAASMLTVSPLLCSTYFGDMPRALAMVLCAALATCAVGVTQWVCRLSEQQRRTAFKQAWLQHHGVLEG